MAPSYFSGRSQATLILFVALAGLSVAALMKRCEAPAKAARAGPGSTPALEGPGRFLPTGDVKTNPPPGPAPSVQPESKPSKPKRSVVVSDIFGVKVKGAEIRFARSDGYVWRLKTGEGGRMEIPDDIWKESILSCGAFSIPLSAIPRGADFDIPGASKMAFGELVLVPGWDDATITLKDEESYVRPTLADPELGYRFLYLRPGIYVIKGLRGPEFATEIVMAGDRTTHVMTKAGLKVNLSFDVEPDPIPKYMSIRIKGVSAGTSPEFVIKMFVGEGQRTFTEYWLEPGWYEVAAEGEFEFSRQAPATAGQITTVEVRVRRRP